MSSSDAGPLGSVQTLVLKPSRQPLVAHHVLRFTQADQARRLLRELGPGQWLSWGPGRPGEAGEAKEPEKPPVERALGFTFQGLQTLELPGHLLGTFQRLSPAFTQGATLRAAHYLGDTGQSAPERWDDAFGHFEAHAVLTVHGDASDVAEECAKVAGWRQACGVHRIGHYEGGLKRPKKGPGEMLPFDFRDGLVHPVVQGMEREDLKGRQDVHARGELLLGYANEAGRNRWGPGELDRGEQDFFTGGSFGVFRPIQQHVTEFDAAVERWAHELARYLELELDQATKKQKLSKLKDFIKAKLCGRWPDGQLLHPEDTPFGKARRGIDGKVTFDGDAEGEGCPYASHIRRMNPRDGERPRPLFRRGKPFPPPPLDSTTTGQRGLLGLFFCSSLEEQCEQLLGQWGQRLPMGARDDSSAKDPFMGAHDDGQASFRIPFAGKSQPLVLRGFKPFVRTLGTAYAFYPSRTGFDALLKALPAA